MFKKELYSNAWANERLIKELTEAQSVLMQSLSPSEVSISFLTRSKGFQLEVGVRTIPVQSLRDKLP
jgi:hypothetical protein